jgi:hypothetical protein
MRYAHSFFPEKAHLENQNTDGSLTVKCILKIQSVYVDWNHLAQRKDQ